MKKRKNVSRERRARAFYPTSTNISEFVGEGSAVRVAAITLSVFYSHSFISIFHPPLHIAAAAAALYTCRKLLGVAANLPDRSRTSRAFFGH